jgi:hypothetical protein
MSERGAKILREEMQTMGPVRLRDVEEAQLFMVNLAKELAATGEIFLADGNNSVRQRSRPSFDLADFLLVCSSLRAGVRPRTLPSACRSGIWPCRVRSAMLASTAALHG